jgi:hypothetical protein
VGTVGAVYCLSAFHFSAETCSNATPLPVQPEICVLSSLLSCGLCCCCCCCCCCLRYELVVEDEEQQDEAPGSGGRARKVGRGGGIRAPCCWGNLSLKGSSMHPTDLACEGCCCLQC